MARTRDEAHLYLDLHPCDRCGSIDVMWESALVNVSGELVNRYSGPCEGCSVEREFLFGVPRAEAVPHGYPTFGGAEASQLLDAGEWLWVADLALDNAPSDDSPAQAMAIAAAAIDEVIKFIPPDADEVPETSFWSPRGRQVRDADATRFSRDLLVVTRDRYRDIVAT